MVFQEGKTDKADLLKADLRPIRIVLKQSGIL